MQDFCHQAGRVKNSPNICWWVESEHNSSKEPIYFFHTVAILCHSKHFDHSLYLTFPSWNLHASHHFLAKGASGLGLWTPDPECAEHAAAPWAPRTKRLPIQESWAWDACLVPWVSMFGWGINQVMLVMITWNFGEKVTWQFVFSKLGGFNNQWNWVVVSNMSYFHRYLGKGSNLTDIFRMGWKHLKAPTNLDLLVV